MTVEFVSLMDPLHDIRLISTYGMIIPRNSLELIPKIILL